MFLQIIQCCIVFLVMIMECFDLVAFVRLSLLLTIVD